MSGGFTAHTELHASQLNGLMANTAAVSHPTCVINTQYTNTSTQPLLVLITLVCANATPTPSAEIFIDDVGVAAIIGKSITIPVSFIVPPGSTYRVSNYGTSVTVWGWIETTIG